jgi:DNA-binding NtrC family response regulator
VVGKSPNFDHLKTTLAGLRRDEHSEVFRRSAAMAAVGTLVRQAAAVDTHVLIRGEAGVGKEVVARALHHYRLLPPGAFAKLNCKALPPDLMAGELFGSARGRGGLALAGAGTLFVDEVAEMPLELQARLRLALVDRQFFALGSRQPVRVDARIVAATTRDLPAMVAAGTFDRGLLDELAIVTILVPPLRERREEIPLLFEHFRKKFERHHRRVAPPLSEITRALLGRYDWPGNVTELEHIVKRYVVLGSERHLGDELRVRLGGPRAAAPATPPPANLAQRQRTTPPKRRPTRDRFRD